MASNYDSSKDVGGGMDRGLGGSTAPPARPIALGPAVPSAQAAPRQNFFTRRYDELKGQLDTKDKLAKDKADKEQSLTDEMDAYWKKLMDTYDPDGAYAKQLTQSTQNAAYRAARDRGIRGPLSQTGAQQATANAMYNLAQHRDELGQAGLTMRNNRDMGLSQLHQSENQFNQNMSFQQQQYADAQRRYRDENSFWGSNGLGGKLVGGGLNAIGTVAGAYFGGSAGAAVGGAAGKAAGTAITGAADRKAMGY